MTFTGIVGKPGRIEREPMCQARMFLLAPPMSVSLVPQR